MLLGNFHFKEEGKVGKSLFYSWQYPSQVRSQGRYHFLSNFKLKVMGEGGGVLWMAMIGRR